MPLGDHRLEVRASVANPVAEAPVEAYTWTVADLTAPQTAIEFGPDDPTGSDVASFSFLSEVNATFQCSLNGAPYASCNPSTQFSGLLPGEHELQVRAVDVAGNFDPTPATYSWTVVAAPETTIDSGPDADVTTTTASFTFSSDQAGGTFECALDGGPFESCTSPHEVQELTDGDHVLRVRARNSLGIVDPEPAEYDFVVDLPPNTTIDTGPDATTTSTSAVFLLSSNELDVNYECKLDDGAFAPCVPGGSVENSHVILSLGLGPHELQVRAVDGAGNVDGTPATYEWTVVAPPNTPLGTDVSVEVEAPSGSTTATLTFPEVTTAGMTTITALTSPPALPEGYQVGAGFFDLDTTADYTPPISVCLTYDPVSAPPSGMRLLHGAGGAWTDVTTTDDPVAGVVCGEVSSLSPFAVAAEEDATAPETTIDSGPEASTASTGATFTFSSDEDGSTYECSLNGSNFTACASPKEYEGLGLGDHELRVRAIDQAGNRDESPATQSWSVIDARAPETSIETGPSAITPATTATIEFYSDEAGSSFECSLDAGPYLPCESPKTYEGLGVGDHTFRVRAVDAAGNREESPAVETWTVVDPPDTTAPDTAIASAPQSGTSTSAAFGFSATESATFECAVDSSSFTPCSSPQAYSGLAVGTHVFRVRATDTAGNVDASPATHSWTISAPAPTCTVSTQTLGANADAWILQSSAGQNYGTDSVLKVDTKSASNARALVRFNLPAIPAGCTVTSAKLRLHASSYKAGRQLRAFRLNAAWTEGGVRWNNQPGTSGAAATTTSGAGYREWIVTSQVQSMYSDGNFGFLIRDETENATGFEQALDSREKKETPPRLVITFG